MIKIIHYIWFGGKELPQNIKSTIASWKKYCPDWEIIRHDESNTDILKYRWVREAIDNKKYAFASDFIRLEILYNQGGLYLDTDLQLYKSIEEYINTNRFVSGMMNHRAGMSNANRITEDGIDMDTHRNTIWYGLQVGFIYSEPKHPFIKNCINNIYANGDKQFLNADGSNNGFVIEMPMARELLRFGFKYRDYNQELLCGVKIYNTNILATRKTKNRETIAIHWFDQSWMPDLAIKMKIKKAIKKYLYFLYRRQ